MKSPESEYRGRDATFIAVARYSFIVAAPYDCKSSLPQTILEIEPAWRGFEYFMIRDQIVIVDPRSMEVVAVLEA